VLSPSADGRNNLAQGESPGKNGPHPLGVPLPRLAGGGGGGAGPTQDPRLKPWGNLCRPSADGLTYATDLGYGTLACHSERSEESRKSYLSRARFLAALGMIRRLTDSQGFFIILLERHPNHFMEMKWVMMS